MNSYYIYILLQQIFVCIISDLNTTFGIVDSNIYHWPGEYDVKATAEAILRLRVFYYFDIDALIDGYLMNDRVLPLNPSQVLKIIKIAEGSNMLNEARLWCEALIRKLPFNSHLDESVNVISILRMLASIHSKVGIQYLFIRVKLNYKTISQSIKNRKSWYDKKIHEARAFNFTYRYY